MSEHCCGAQFCTRPRGSLACILLLTLCLHLACVLVGFLRLLFCCPSRRDRACDRKSHDKHKNSPLILLERKRTAHKGTNFCGTLRRGCKKKARPTPNASVSSQYSAINSKHVAKLRQKKITCESRYYKRRIYGMHCIDFVIFLLLLLVITLCLTMFVTLDMQKSVKICLHHVLRR